MLFLCKVSHQTLYSIIQQHKCVGRTTRQQGQTNTRMVNIVLTRQPAGFLVSVSVSVELDWIDLHCVIAERRYSSGLQKYFKLSFGLVMSCKYELQLSLTLRCAFVSAAWEACSNGHNTSTITHCFIYQTHSSSYRAQTKLLVEILNLPVKELHDIFHSSLVSHVINGLIGLPVLCLVGLQVMDLELFDRWVYLSLTPLLQMMMMLRPLPHHQHPNQVGTHNKPSYFITPHLTLWSNGALISRDQINSILVWQVSSHIVASYICQTIWQGSNKS